MTTNIADRLVEAQNALALEQARHDKTLSELYRKIHLEKENEQLKRDISVLKIIIDNAPEETRQLAKSII